MIVLLPTKFGRYWGDDVRRTAIALATLACMLLTFGALRAQDATEEPAEIDKKEQVDVDLMLIDVLVMGQQDRTIGDLTKDDFQMTIAEQAVSVDTFDVYCPEGGLPEPTEAKRHETRPLQPDIARKIVLAVDYTNIRMNNKAPVVNQAQWMVQNYKTDAEEIMIVSIADGLRIEQPFSRSKGQAVGTLNRMEHDVTLWGRDFQQGVSGETYFDNLSTLMDIMAQYDGAKTVVMFSEFMGGGSRDWDIWYNDVAQRAANSQTAFYPVAAYGLGGGPAGGPAGLARLANESGGRMTFNSNDLSLGYVRAQRDMSCRYTLGHYLEPKKGRQKNKVRVYVRGDREQEAKQVRYPEQIKMWTDEELQDSALRAAHADPGPFQNPLIRSFVFPIAPRSATSWDTLVAVNFDMPVEPEGVDIDLSATLLKGTAISKQYKGTRFHVAPPKDGGDERMVTLVGEGKIKPGDHRLNIVLSRADGDRKPHTTQAIINLPEVPEGELFVNGPFLARAVPDGVLIRSGDSGRSKKGGPSPLEQVIGPDASWEPLFVYQIGPDDTLLAAWSACIVGGDLPTDATIERHVLDDDGKVVHELDALPLRADKKGKVRCYEELDSLPGGTLQPGDYMLRILAKDSGGKELVSESVPLLVQ